MNFGEFEIFHIRLPRRFAPRNDTGGKFFDTLNGVPMFGTPFLYQFLSVIIDDLFELFGN